jgi:HD-GYP domain-containing protein (c-di-GMP phosphodiesterase class II)
VAGLRAGAFDFLAKPYTSSELDGSLTRAIERRRQLVQHEEYRVNLERMVEEREAEIHGTNSKLQQLYALGNEVSSFVDFEPKLSDFTQYVSQHFRPDTFGIFIEEGARLKQLAFFDRHGRPFEPNRQNESIYRFPLEHETFRGHIYVGYDGNSVHTVEKERHIFGLFQDRVGSYLKEHYMGRRHREEMRKMFVSSIQAHARSIEAKDAYTAGHCDRVDRYAELIARRHGGFDEKWIFNLKVASILHDIGKIGVRSAILCKPGSLDSGEAHEMRSHPVIGGRIVKMLYGFNLEAAVRHHHERFDGTGYPSRLGGDMIPVESRIILIADTFDAMTSDRPYRRALPTGRALEELRTHAGTQVDPFLVEVTRDAAAEIDAARMEMEKKPKGNYFV